MSEVEFAMNKAETDILRFFRSYGVRANEMLFFNRGQSKTRTPQFSRAMHSMMQRGLIVQERHRDAYSLTDVGYRVSLAVGA